MRVQLDAFFNLKVSDDLRKRTDIPATVLAKSFEFAMTISEVKILDLFNPRWTMKIGEVEITKIEKRQEWYRRDLIDYWYVETETELWVKDDRYILKRSMHWYLSKYSLSGGTFGLELIDGQTGEQIV